VATVTISFLVFFMLREGPRWVDAGLDLLPPASRPRWERVLAGMARTIRGYVTGNLLISLVAGIVCYLTPIATGVPYALPLSVLVAVLDLIPLVGATLATVLVAAVALGQGLVPWLVVLAVLLGSQVAGIIGALLAIPVAGSIQVVLVELINARRDRERARWGAETG
jgi:predicted PurR-regulated permease PerM